MGEIGARSRSRHQGLNANSKATRDLSHEEPGRQLGDSMGKQGLSDDLRAKLKTGAELLGDCTVSNINAAMTVMQMTQVEFADAAKIDKNTLGRILSGKTKPHVSTLRKIAGAIGLDNWELLQSPDFKKKFEPKQVQSANPISTPSGKLDRATNPMVGLVVKEYPEVFREFTEDDWESLYSCHGVGGPLTEQGVIAEAMLINRRRKAIQQLGELFDGGQEAAKALAILIDIAHQSVQVQVKHKRD